MTEVAARLVDEVLPRMPVRSDDEVCGRARRRRWTPTTPAPRSSSLLKSARRSMRGRGGTGEGVHAAPTGDGAVGRRDSGVALGDHQIALAAFSAARSASP